MKPLNKMTRKELLKGFDRRTACRKVQEIVLTHGENPEDADIKSIIEANKKIAGETK